MKGDFSRIRFNPSRHYTSVLQQQGRVSLDADANEQAAINEYIRGTETRDVIGCYGGPQGDEGFEITVQRNAILIGSGRYYVRGILCQNEQPLDYASQPFLINPGQTDAQLLGELRGSAVDAVAVYLEVWQRLVTALDDACLREPALGQADTTARVQTVWRVVAEPLGSSSSDRTPSTGPVTPVVIDRGPQPVVSVLRSSARVAEDLNRVTGAAGFVNPSPFGPGPFRPGPFPGPLPQTMCAAMYTAAAAGDKGTPGKLSAHTDEGSGDGSCQPTPSAGFRGLENQLYRVEIHQGGDEARATFKWSRENGSVVAAVTGVSGANVQVDSLGLDTNLGFTPGQWVELTDDSYLFGQPPNQPGELYQIQSTAPEQLSVTMSRSVVAVDPAKNARLRRWDQSGGSAGSGGVSLSAGLWLDLENGIQVQFTPGQYQSGDCWLIPARTASGQIDWPPCDSDGAAFQPAHRTRVFRAPLASLTWDATNERIAVTNCRRVFAPLTDLGVSTTAALHVSKINWANDDVMALDVLIANGLQVTLDQAATGDVDPGNFTVSLEVAVPVKGDNFAVRSSTGVVSTDLPPVILRRPMIIDGQVSVQGTAILWQISADYPALDEINQALLPAAQYRQWARARVKLLGRTVFAGSAGSLLFLDGQSYGTPGVRADQVTPRIDLQLPSGNLEKASDFESWFYLAPVLQISALTISPPVASIVVTQTGTEIVAAGQWVANTAYNIGDQVIGFYNNVQQCIVAGTSGGSIPKWASGAGATTQDGGVTWRLVPPVAVSPQGTVTFNYPASVDTTVTLSVTGPSGVARAISVPPTVIVPANQTAQTFAITVQGNPVPTQDYTIFAYIPSGLGPSVQHADFSLTGWVEIN